MKSVIVVLLTSLMLISVNVFAEDVFISSTGGLEIGTSNPDAKLEVLGETNRAGVVGETSGTGIGIYGINETAGGFAGYFLGDTKVQGNLIVTGSINGGGAGGGGITGVTAGEGLSGGGTSGDVVLDINYAGNGYLTSAARSDHDHGSVYSLSIHSHSGWLSTSGGNITGALTIDNGLTVGTGLDQFIISGGNVGIGMSPNSSKLSADGMIESINEGFKFPDGSVQLTAYDPVGYGVVKVVAKNGGDFTDPVTAMNNVNVSWCFEDEDEIPPCLLKIMPGVYDIGANTLQMLPYVDIEGSGENVTKITGSVYNAGSNPSTGVVRGASNAEIRSLTIENTSTTSHVTGIYNSGASPKISNVTINVLGGYDSRGVFNESSSSPEMDNLTVTVIGTRLGYAIENSSSSPTLNNVTVNAEGTNNGWGVFSAGNSNIEITHSKIQGSTHSISSGPGAILLVANTKLDGGVDPTSLTVTCAGVFRVNYEFYPSTCPTF